jgi:hypothetical protein
MAVGAVNGEMAAKGGICRAKVLESETLVVGRDAEVILYGLKPMVNEP